METKQETWHALDVTADSEAAEAVEFALNELDALGTEINNLGKTPQPTLTITGYFNAPFANQIINQALVEAVQIYGMTSEAIKDFRWREVENQDWLAEWKKHWRPTETARFIIAATWAEVEPTGKIVIRIEPSMAFGTGTHETTRLCLKAIEENYTGEMSFLDVGTGTGILAIAAVKSATERTEQTERNKQPNSVNSAAKILACDTDDDSIKIAIENAEMNDAADIEFYVGSITAETPVFDFVCANLTADVIVPLLPLLVEKSKKFLILSGILKEQEKLVTDELAKIGVTNPKIETDGEWIALQLKK